MSRPRWAGVWVGILAGSLAAAGLLLAGDTMKFLAAEVPLPTDSAPRELGGLVYSTSAWHAGIRSIRLQELPAADAKEVLWLLSTTNTRSDLQRVEIDLFLLDAAQARVANGHLSGVLPGGERGEMKVKVKLPPGSWSNARSVRIEVKFKAR